MWGWVPALLWVVFGSIFIGAVHDFGALVVSLRNNGQTVGDIAGRVLNKRVRLLFLFVLFMALTIVLAIFGLVIAAVFKRYPQTIIPCLVQIPIAVAIGLWVHRRGRSILLPSLIALVVMYVTVILGDWGPLHTINQWLAGQSIITWCGFLLVYSYIASVLPVWTLLQPRDYINSLQLVSALALIVLGLLAAATLGGAPPVEGAERQPLEIVAPAWDFEPSQAPLIFPFLFITMACGAISGFHCLVSSGTSSKQLTSEKDARFVGYGSMLTEGFLATLVILACVAGLGLGYVVQNENAFASFSGINYVGLEGQPRSMSIGWGPGEEGSATTFVPSDDNAFGDSVNEFNFVQSESGPTFVRSEGVWIAQSTEYAGLVGASAWNTRYESWSAANGLGAKVGAFVDGSANFLQAIHVGPYHFPPGVAIALMGVLVASFAGTTLDTACRLQRYVVQELAACFLPTPAPNGCPACGYDLTGNTSGTCPECGADVSAPDSVPHGSVGAPPPSRAGLNANPLTWLANKHGATIFAVVVAFAMAAMPTPGSEWSWANAGKGGLILWPMFGATNQLLGGLAFLVIAFYLWRRGKPVWFLILPLIFMLIMPAWAMLYLLPEWITAESKNWPLIVIAIATLALEVWMIIEAFLLMPRVRGVLERELPGSSPTAPASEGVGSRP